MGCSHRGGAVPREVRDGRESGTAHLPGVHALPSEEWSPISLSVVFLFLGWLRMTAARCQPPPLFFFLAFTLSNGGCDHETKLVAATADLLADGAGRWQLALWMALARPGPSHRQLAPLLTPTLPGPGCQLRTARSTASFVPGCARSLLAPSWPLDPSPAAAATPEGATPRPSPSHRRCMYGSGAPARS
ncbi:hypothetical protein I4F81_010364 [Pyropia yezoensis]|uniref:Uncharacterized protein n=1 Tax=Pyropia yezoensis TaxID=2788 RepID=A0ACC3CDL8_PYRYE|nr:hypothetical protein I4F81_010364 [Neopyropia yezoensis]